jgi:hypothetical protein
MAPRTEIIFAIGLLMFAAVTTALVTVAIAMGMRVEAPPPLEATPQGFTVPTAREAYPPALERARERDPRAELASAVGVWTPGTPFSQVQSGRTGWTFHFFLPGERAMVSIVANTSQQAELTGERAWLSDPALLDDQFWQLDSSIVGNRFAETCSEAWQANPDARVEFRLSTAATNGRLQWAATLTEGQNDLCSVRVDATSGRVLP